uniref:Uncharacterized protein n=1 Tax=Rhizophora mucronata TaxID=61149 RepID=A0A2P2PEV1_RHIMU
MILADFQKFQQLPHDVFMYHQTLESSSHPQNLNATLFMKLKHQNQNQ